LDFSNKYILGFALAVCLVCSLAVSSLAVALDDRIDSNKRLDQQLNILRVAGLIESNEKPSAEEANVLFENIEVLKVSRDTGEVIAIIGFGELDMVKAAKDDELSTETTDPKARRVQISRTPNELIVYKIVTAGKECYVLPFWGNGLWSTMRGFLALETNLLTIKGLTYAEHGETAGLGGEVDNPRWKAHWPGKMVYDADGAVAIDVVKFGTVKVPANQVDGISGATITSVAVGGMLQVWLGDNGYGAYLEATRGGEEGSE